VWLDALDFEDDTGIHKLDLVMQPDRIGDVTSQFERAEPCMLGLPDISAGSRAPTGSDTPR
jgi:hypothetical protein